MANAKSGLDPEIVARIKRELAQELEGILFALRIASDLDLAIVKFRTLPRGEQLAVFRQALAELAREFTPTDSDEND